MFNYVSLKGLLFVLLAFQIATFAQNPNIYGFKQMMPANDNGTDNYKNKEPAEAVQTIFSDDFEKDLSRWELYGKGGAFIENSNDSNHKKVLVLRPQGDVLALVKGSEKWGGLRIEGEVLFPDSTDNYLGVIYNFRRRGQRTDFGLIYIKGNENYLIVNPHRDFNVNRLLYEEYRTPLKDDDVTQVGKWQKFKAEVIGNTCHFFVGNMDTPQVTFSHLELNSGAIGLQPRSVGGDVWVDNVKVTQIKEFSYKGNPRPEIKYETDSLLTNWEVIGNLSQTKDEIARNPSDTKYKWIPFETDGRGAVVTNRIVDYHGTNSVAYFRVKVEIKDDKPAFLHISTIDDLALWVNGRFHWFIPRRSMAWYDFWKNPNNKGQRIPLPLNKGKNELIFRVRGGVYAGGGFFARIEQS